MKKKMLNGLILAFTLAVLLPACDKDNDGETNEEEVITTMTLTFVPQGGGTTIVYDFDDPDGPGGAAPTQDEIVLVPGKAYDVSITLTNKTTNPDEDITTEVSDEAEAHRFYFASSAGSNISVSNLNNDPDGVPLGLTSTWTTTTNATGTMTVTLRHYPGNPPGKALADPVDSPKSGTDIEVVFNTRIQ